MVIRSRIDTRCGEVNRPVRSPRSRSSVSIIRVVDVLPLVPVTCTTGKARCGSPSRLTSAATRSSVGSIWCSAGATRSRARPRAAARLCPPGAAYCAWWIALIGAAGENPARSQEEARRASSRAMSDSAAARRWRDFAMTSAGALSVKPRCRAWPASARASLRAAARSFSSRLRSAATSTVPARSSSTVTPSVSEGRGDGEAVLVRGRPGAAGSGSDSSWPRQRGGSMPARRAGHPLARPQPLVGTEPADLGHQAHQRLDLGLGRRVAERERRPGRHHHRVLAGQRASTARRSRTASPGGAAAAAGRARTRAPAGRLVRRARHRAQRHLGQLQVPVAELVPGEVVERLAHLAELELLEAARRPPRSPPQPGQDPAVGRALWLAVPTGRAAWRRAPFISANLVGVPQLVAEVPRARPPTPR